MALTDTFVKNTTHTGKATCDEHSDAHGLYLHITAASNYWRLAYRFAEKQMTLALGVYPAVCLSIARAGRPKARELLAAGTDPGAAKQAEKAVKLATADIIWRFSAAGKLAYLTFCG